MLFARRCSASVEYDERVRIEGTLVDDDGPLDVSVTLEPARTIASKSGAATVERIAYLCSEGGVG